MTVYRTRPEALAESGSLHPVYLAQLCQVARDEDLAPERLLGDSGLDERSLHRPVPVQALHRVLARLQEWVQARQPGRNLALDLGLDTPVTAHGPLTLLLNSAPTLRQGLQALADHLPLRTEILCLELAVEGPATRIRLSPAVVLGPQAPFLLEWGLACLVNLLHEALGPGLSQLGVQLPQADAARAWQIRLAPWGAEVRHQGPQAQLSLPHGLLDAPLPGASAHEHAQALRACAELARAHQQAREHKARLMALLLDPEAAHGFRLEAASRALGLSPATLRRHLQVRGCTFDALADDCRKRLAWSWLHDTALPVAEVAQRLGYGDTSNFSRCCRRWFGQTPRDLRQTGVSRRDDRPLPDGHSACDF